MRRTSRPISVLFVLLILVSLAIATTGCGDSRTADVVSLQLNWYHEAEFVGYYVAQDKGFYEAADLDVDIREGGPPQGPARDEVLNGNVTFAVTSFGEQRDLIVAGEPTVAVMSAFQIPPLVIFSLASSDIRQPADLVGKTVGVTTDYWSNILEETLVAAGVDPASVAQMEVETDQMAFLYSGVVDAWLGYAQDEPIRAEVTGYPVNNIFPADYGIGGYEGLLVALDSTIEQHPDLVQRFVEATSQGWQYALEHQDEAAQILDSWAPGGGIDFQRLAVRAVAPLVDIPQVPIGWIDEARWQQLMGDDFDSQQPGYTMQFIPTER